MRQSITRQIVGYDPQTEAVAFERDIPVNKWGAVTSLVKPNDDDPGLIYNYRLDISVANDILGIIGQKGQQNLDYFLEFASD